MTFDDIKSAIKQVIKTSECGQCKSKFDHKSISVIATTSTEGLFEAKCPTCKAIAIISVFLSSNKPQNQPEPQQQAPERHHRSVSQDDILDVKNFLTSFDGNFKKIFEQKK